MPNHDNLGLNTWQIRSPHTPKRLFENPAMLWEAAQEFFQWCDDNPWHRYELLKGGDNAGRVVSVPVPRVYTIWGFCLYLGVTVQYLSIFKHEHPDDEFTNTINLIMDAIKANKFEGAANRMYDGGFIAKDLGMIDRRDMTTAGQQITGPRVIINMPGSLTINLPSNTDGELTDAEHVYEHIQHDINPNPTPTPDPLPPNDDTINTDIENQLGADLPIQYDNPEH